MQARLPAFSYAGPPKGRSYEAWREQFCRGFCRLDAETGMAERIECTVQVTRLGGLSFGAAQGNSGTFLRTRSLLSDGCDDFTLLTAVQGKVFTVQRGISVELEEAQMCLMGLDDVAASGFNNGASFTALRIPRRALTDIYPETEDQLNKPLIANAHLRDLVNNYFALCTGSAASLDAVGQAMMSRHMVELVALLLRAEAGGEGREPRELGGEARLQLIQAHTLQNLSDENLTISSVAKAAGTTPKQVQRLFGAAGSTFSEFVLEQRLQLAYRRLFASAAEAEKISSIALDVGFGDLSYFNRCFRKRFGMTPSECRAAEWVRN